MCYNIQVLLPTLRDSRFALSPSFPPANGRDLEVKSETVQ
jgi:hypothetical protein